ncbi:MAG: hypothetical protein K2X99_03165 [Gemmatimonadaceae bacterium]|nr:hypothetical protein [Gemmatimonadaceae bacterium]
MDSALAAALGRIDGLIDRERSTLAPILLLRTASDIHSIGAEQWGGVLAAWFAPQESRASIDESVLATARALALGARRLVGGRALTSALLREIGLAAAEDPPDSVTPLSDAIARSKGSHDLDARTIASLVPVAEGFTRDPVLALERRMDEPVSETMMRLHRRALRTASALSRHHQLQVGARTALADEGRGRFSQLALLDAFASTPVLSAVRAAAAIEGTVPTADAAIDACLERGELREITGLRRGRLYALTSVVEGLACGA